jgi:hypothetical protein
MPDLMPGDASAFRHDWLVGYYHTQTGMRIRQEVPSDLCYRVGSRT